MSYGDALRKAAEQLGGTPCPTLLEALAKVHATKYQCNYTWNAAGSAVFYDGDESTRDTRNESARKSWERNVMVHFKSTERARAEPTKMRVTAAEREAFKAFLAACGGDKKRAAAVFKALNA
jgi:hypothetical protein